MLLLDTLPVRRLVGSGRRTALAAFSRPYWKLLPVSRDLVRGAGEAVDYRLDVGIEKTTRLDQRGDPGHVRSSHEVPPSWRRQRRRLHHRTHLRGRLLAQ